MDTRLICLEVMSIIKKHHPCPVPTHWIYGEIDACRRSIQRQIKFLCESNLIERKPDYKVGLKT